MELNTIKVDPGEARRAFLEYKRAVEEADNKDISDLESRASKRRAELTEIDRALMNSYRTLSRHKRVLVLEDALRAGGVDDRGRPKLAVARADERRIEVYVNTHGTVTYRPIVSWQRGENNPRTGIAHERVFEYRELVPRISGGITAESDVPFIPPGMRPATLDRYHILWEANWKTAPVDPVLLRGLGMGLYAVVAMWDLTPLEAAILSSR